jgi:hypothetical protein
MMVLCQQFTKSPLYLAWRCRITGSAFFVFPTFGLATLNLIELGWIEQTDDGHPEEEEEKRVFI